MSLTFKSSRDAQITIPWMSGKSRSAHGSPSALLPEEYFVAAVSLERKRTERSAKHFLLALADLSGILDNKGHEIATQPFAATVGSLIRETDVIGWYRGNQVLGVIFTELGDADKSSILASVKQRMTTAFHSTCGSSGTDALGLSFHFFPEDPRHNGLSADLTLYPDVSGGAASRRPGQIAKRMMDLTASAIALAVLSPLLLVVALLIKSTSKGPVFFRQLRVGQYGRPFTFLKFRSMFVNNDASIHREYVSKFIAGTAAATPREDGAETVYKITQDPRITSLGRFLRKTSLDELPQLINVLKGEMSLIGPRPPVPYEFECYDIWHRRRVMEIKPGITGLWQVNGRSKTTFDDMVRLDLRYAQHWSLLLDFKILLQTPGAVLSGDGAY